MSYDDRTFSWTVTCNTMELLHPSNSINWKYFGVMIEDKTVHRYYHNKVLFGVCFFFYCQVALSKVMPYLLQYSHMIVAAVARRLVIAWLFINPILSPLHLKVVFSHPHFSLFPCRWHAMFIMTINMHIYMTSIIGYHFLFHLQKYILNILCFSFWITVTAI